ncbi:hypothetical protein F3J19_23005 [Burkholderia sp. Ax-1724]|nr:hypothetical protein [Burkholderia sp. Ax-1724]
MHREYQDRHSPTHSRVWFSTEAARGIGRSLAHQTLADGDAVAAPPCTPGGLREAFNENHARLLALECRSGRMASRSQRRRFHRLISPVRECWKKRLILHLGDGRFNLSNRHALSPCPYPHSETRTRK